MSARVEVYLEVGSKRVFAGSLQWPGWCRSGRDQDAALEALLAYGPRYAKAVGRVEKDFEPPASVSDLVVVERLRGNATTDFGAPSAIPEADERALGAGELERLVALLRAAWRKFDRAAEAAEGVTLRTGPRGGGRDLPKIVRHVLEADGAYLGRLGERAPGSKGTDVAVQMAETRDAIVAALGARARGEAPPPSRRTSPLWPVRYAVRRSAWHALDHAWEIEDRATG